MQHAPEAHRRGAVGLHAAAVAERDAPVALPDGVGLGNGGMGVGAGLGDLGHARVHAAVDAQRFARDLFAIGEHDDNVATGLGQHVRRGEDQPVFADDDARAHRPAGDHDADGRGPALVGDAGEHGVERGQVLARVVRRGGGQHGTPAHQQGGEHPCGEAAWLHQRSPKLEYNLA